MSSKVYRPEPNIEIEAELGRFLIAWNALEGEVDDLLGDLLRVDLTAGMKVAGVLMLQSKLRLLKSLFADLRGGHPLVGPGLTAEAEFDALAKATLTLNEERNAIIHGRASPMDFGEGDVRPLWVKWSAKGTGMEASVLAYASGMLARPISEAHDLADRWSRLAQSLEGTLQAIALADADDLLSGAKEGRGTLELQIQSIRSGDKPKR